MAILLEPQEQRNQTFDPYDIWSTRVGITVRHAYYSGSFIGKMSAITLALGDWLIPGLSRKMVGAKRSAYPIVEAHRVLQLETEEKLTRKLAEELLAHLVFLRSRNQGKHDWAWGLGFPWMSKNGLYGPDVPFVTHTPYVMEALFVLANKPALRDEAMAMFHGTWLFLESLRVMYQGDAGLALSYAPVDEPRIVVNANTYAALAYALHAVHGKSQIREQARVKAQQLVRWVASQQRPDGSWFYYADVSPGNFIDCFHSCFVVKNLLKIRRLLPDLVDLVDPAVERGWQYIQNNFYNYDKGLCRRFTVRSQRDPFRWDLYDQAEFLGLLVDFRELERASAFVRGVEKRFRKGDDWYCRIDILGRRWGKNFLRWGIVPFWYHRARMKRAMEGAQ